MKIIISIFLSCIYLFSANFCAATFNVENLFDGVNNGNEYKEFLESKYGWSKEEAQEKFKKTLQVLKDVNSDIIALQEVENEKLIVRLKEALGHQYHAFAINKKSSIGLGIISKYPILEEKSYTLKGYERFRPILYTKIKIENEEINFYTNHFPSLKHEDSFRLAFAKSLKYYIEQNNDKKYIVIGDFNMPHEDNSILNIVFGTTLYDPWFEVSVKKRWSYVYKNSYDALDRILLSNSLLNQNGFIYKGGSFKPLFFDYALNNKGEPKGNFRGYSDHIPLIACFDDEVRSIIDLPKVTTKILNATVLYKDTRGTVVYDGEKNIFIKNESLNVEVGKSYEIELILKENDNFKRYKIIKEINKVHNISLHEKSLINIKYLKENDVLKEINGVFKNGKIIGTFGEIQFYKISGKPKEGEKLTIKSARAQKVKGKLEIIAQ